MIFKRITEDFVELVEILENDNKNYDYKVRVLKVTSEKLIEAAQELYKNRKEEIINFLNEYGEEELPGFIEDTILNEKYHESEFIYTNDLSDIEKKIENV